jgi:hypothetical protein
MVGGICAGRLQIAQLDTRTVTRTCNVSHSMQSSVIPAKAHYCPGKSVFSHPFPCKAGEGWDGGILNCRETQHEDAPTLALPRYRRGEDKTRIAIFDVESCCDD